MGLSIEIGLDLDHNLDFCWIQSHDQSIFQCSLIWIQPLIFP